MASYYCLRLFHHLNTPRRDPNEILNNDENIMVPHSCKSFHNYLFAGIAAFNLFVYNGFRALRASYLTHLLVQPTIRRDVLCALTNKTEILKNAISKNLIPEAMGSYVYLHQRWDACYLAAST
jgi:hypothetical protein